MSKIIILNGPIGCGKDTVGMAFANAEGYELTCFKEPMFRIAANTMGYGYDEFMDLYRDREWKDSPNEKLNGHTVRELMIHISEVYIKPFVGPDYFGQQAVEYIRQRPWQRTFVFADGGFAAEIDVLAQAGHDVLLVHMYRDGCTFEGDSRSYVLTNSVPRIYTLTNNGTVEEAVEELGRIVDQYDDSRTPESDSEEEDIPRRNGNHRRWTVRTPSAGQVSPRTQRMLEAAAVGAHRRGTGTFGWDANGEPIAQPIAWSDAGATTSADGAVATGTIEATDWYTAFNGVNLEAAVSTTSMDEIEPMSEGIAG